MNDIPVINQFSTGVADPCLGKDCYSLFSGFADALGGKLGTIQNSASLGEFLNTLIGFGIGIGGVLAIAMIMYQGFSYMQTDRPDEKGRTRAKILNAVVGFLLLLTIFTILRTINPDLLNLTPGIDRAALTSGVQLSPDQFQTITGEPLEKPGTYDQLARQVAQETRSDYCALRVIIQNETRGNAALIGQDENAPYDAIPSRKAFIASGEKYSGTTFNPSNTLITRRTFCNDAAGCNGKAPNPDSPNLGLDWRFSKGVGLTQITFFPSDYASFNTPGYIPKASNRNIVPKRTFNFSGETVTISPIEALKPKRNLEISAKLWNAGITKCKSPQGAFATYACGNCSCRGSFAQTEIAERTSQYNSCKKENP